MTPGIVKTKSIKKGVIFMAQKEVKSKKVRGKLFSLENSRDRTLSHDELVTRVIMKLGFTTNSKGFPYLKKEVILLINDDNKFKRISKLHEQVALEESKDITKKQVSASDVERAIKTAINNAWKRERERIQKITGEQKKPTSERLISEIAKKITKKP